MNIQMVAAIEFCVLAIAFFLAWRRTFPSIGWHGAGILVACAILMIRAVVILFFAGSENTHQFGWAVESLIPVGILAYFVIRILMPHFQRPACKDELSVCRAYLSIAPEAIIVYDRRGAILETNEKAKLLLGMPHKEGNSIGFNMRDLPIEDLTGQTSFNDLWLVPTRGNSREVEFGKSEGERFHLLLDIVPLDEDRMICFCQDLTALRTAQKELEESERRFSAYMNRIPALAVMHDINGVVLHGNRFTEEFSQKGPLEGRNYWEIFPELTKEELEQEADRVTRGETLLVQRTLTAPDGERRIFRIQLFPVPQSDDANQSFVVGRIGIDITEQFRIQEALKASEHEKSAILDCIAEGVVLLDLDHRIQWANSSVSQTLHKPLDEIIGKKCHQVWHNSMEPCSICPVMEARNSLSPAAHEIETPDGRIFLVHAAPILDSANKLSGAVETVLDITDIKRTENELRKSQEQLNLAMEGARLFSWDWHIPTGVFYSDRQWENRFGYSREELPKTIDQVFSLVHPEDLPSLKHAIQKHFEEKSRVFSFEFRIRSKSDNYIWVMSLGAVLALNDDGRPLRMVGVSRDITEQKQAREEIDQQRNALYHMNRTATMGELTASLAHELNQPLAAIMTNAQAAKRLLEKEPADLAEAAEALDDIIQDDHRAGETILRIRRMLQKGEIEMAPVEINHLIREVAEFLNSEIIARNVLIHLDLSPNSRLVMGDRIQLQQVLLNLMLNACEAMASSEIEHKVLIIRSDTRSADRVSVSVRDTGCGIAPERLQEIFKLFHSSKAMGMGAGLAICRSIITAHGGEIWAENNQDRGATFTFKLPTISQQDPAQGPPS